MATCLYKPKPCDICKKLIQVGEECEYIAETKTIRHYGCAKREENQPPSPEQFRLAEQLGFIQYSPDMAADGLLRRMLPRCGSPAAGRTASPPSARQIPNLFGESA